MKVEITMSWNDFESLIYNLIYKIQKAKPNIVNIYGIPRGGLCVAVRLSHLLKLPLIMDEKDIKQETLIVDDCIDTGRTLSGSICSRIDIKTINIAVLYYNRSASLKPKFFAHIKSKSTWIIFPWETHNC